jgi:hypothetical protein
MRIIPSHGITGQSQEEKDRLELVLFGTLFLYQSFRHKPQANDEKQIFYGTSQKIAQNYGSYWLKFQIFG